MALPSASDAVPATDGDPPRRRPRPPKPYAPERPGLTRRPPGRVLRTALALAVALLLFAASDPAATFALPFRPVFVEAGAGGWEAWLLGELILALVALLWLVRTLTWLRAHRRRAAAGSARRLVLAPALSAGLLVLAVLTHAPLRARWELSRPAYDRLVATGERVTSPPSGIRPRWVGAYRVSWIEGGSGRLLVALAGTDPGHPTVGFVRRPGGRPEAVDGFPGERTAIDLGGGWYAAAG
jgi:hypothetical protein